jgi:hypothetical protein
MLPAWKSYPRRTRSIICLSNKIPPSDYGDETYYVFPINGARIAESSDDDFWKSGDLIKNRIGLSMEQFTHRFPQFLSIIYSDIRANKYPNIEYLDDADIRSMSETNYTKTMTILDKVITKNVISAIVGDPDNPLLLRLKDRYFKILTDVSNKYQGSWEEYFNGLLEPIANGVYLKTIKGLSFNIAHECWIEEPCFMINKYKMDSFFKKMGLPVLPEPPVSDDED